MTSMDLSVIILSYNVRYLLEACLDSVLEATKSMATEIIVVDNASSDGSALMILTKYPQVKLIVNASNVGFSKANNIGAQSARADKLLILNPDTIVQADAILQSCHYLDLHQDTGAVGVRLVDGQGKYLKESKRGFPDFVTSAFKFLGLHLLFPRVPRINKYYLGHLSEAGTHQVEVLSGAFLMIRKDVFNAAGGFDERFFMYGEDIDLSFRIRQSGKNLVYIGGASIIHLKGRSARSHTYPHVRNFYQAMAIFVQKYQRNFFQRTITQSLIYLATLMSWIKRQVFYNFLFALDVCTIIIMLAWIPYIWAVYWFKDPDHFRNSIFYWNCAGYTLIWLLSLFLFRTYNPIHERQIIMTSKAIWVGTAIILVIYSLLPDTLRTSRAVIVLSGFVLAILLPVLRYFMKPQGNGLRGFLIGDGVDELQLNALLRRLSHQDYFSYLSHFNVDGRQITDVKCLHAIDACIKNQSISHLILNGATTSRSIVLALSRQIAPKTGLFIADLADESSIHRNTIPGLIRGDLQIRYIQNKIGKNLIHILTNILVLPWGWIRKDIRTNYWSLMIGAKNWVGYAVPADSILPYLKPGLWHPNADYLKSNSPPEEINYNYARYYTLSVDIQIILNHLANKN